VHFLDGARPPESGEIRTGGTFSIEHLGCFDDLRVFSEIERKAIDVLGSQYKASCWFQTPCQALQGQTPMAVVQAGQPEAVDAVLTRIAMGVFS
jgi:uncharacterized protein (DUF2384 family)